MIIYNTTCWKNKNKVGVYNEKTNSDYFIGSIDFGLDSM